MITITNIGHFFVTIAGGLTKDEAKKVSLGSFTCVV